MMMKPTTMWPALATVLVLALAACGGGGGSSAATATTAATDPSATGGPAGGGASLRDPAVQQCLADKGITLPSFPQGQGRFGGEGGGGQPPAAGGEAPGNGSRRGAAIDAETQQAMRDCGVTFGQGRGGGAPGALNDPAVQQCLSDKGITVPQFGGGGSSSGSTPSSIDDATRQAIKDCRAQSTTSTTG